MSDSKPTESDVKSFRRELQEAAAAWFSKKGITTQSGKSYCLESFDDWPQNIICTDVTKYVKQERERHLGKNPFSLHRGLHNGLSSQAMIFNLIGPLIVRKGLEPLRDVIEQAGISWPTGNVTAEFEYSDRTVFNETSGVPTSLDVGILGEGRKIFIEAKLVEKGFGSCSVFSGGDCDGRNPSCMDLMGATFIILDENTGNE